MISRSTESSINNKSWDDVLARFDIQDQEVGQMGINNTETADPVITDKEDKQSPRWAARAIVLVGCTAALGNIPLQSFMPGAPTGNHFEITLGDEQEITPQVDTDPTPAIQQASIAMPPQKTPVSVALSKELPIIDSAKELALPSRALETYAGHELINTQSVWRTYTVQRYDDLNNIFSKIKQRSALKTLKKSEEIAKALEKMKLGTIVRAKSHNGKLEELAFTPDNKQSYVVTPDAEGNFKGEWQEKVFEVRQARATFVVRQGLFNDGRKVEVPDNIIRQVISVFDWDIDFSKDVRTGDQVTVVFENIYHHGDLVGSQNLLAAEFINKGKIHRTIRHTTARGLTDYFTPEGREMKRAFIRTPVAHARVSSRFNPGRFHPVLHKIRAHKGTDFAAKTGTPIIATGDGVIQFKGTKGGYGRTIILKHREGYKTLYAHMSRYKDSLKQGQVVAQGDIIGYVGSSGLATGPHLHYEFSHNNTPVDSMTVELPNSMSLTPKELVHFRADAINMNLQLDVLHRFAMENFDINSATGG